jgi:7-cyano-7-deazaguanine synthase in queuosine biosynthesis
MIADACCADHELVRVAWTGGPLVAAQRGLSWPGTPFSGPLFFAIGATVGRTMGLDFVVSGMRYGSSEEDTAFIDAFVALLRTSPWTTFVTPVRPLEGMTYDQVAEAVKADQLVRETYSCALVPRCGVCQKCVTRHRVGIDT